MYVWEGEYEQADDVDMYDKTIEDRRKAVAAENKRQKYSNPVSLLCIYIQEHVHVHIHIHIHVCVLHIHAGVQPHFSKDTRRR